MFLLSCSPKIGTTATQAQSFVYLCPEQPPMMQNPAVWLNFCRMGEYSNYIGDNTARSLKAEAFFPVSQAVSTLCISGLGKMLHVNKQTCVWMKNKAEISLTLLVCCAPDPP